MEGIETINDLEIEMELEGTVTNVAAFGAFVDVGVHQDGLVHVSQLADRFVKDPHEVVKTGQVVKVTVTEVDVARKRIALTMRKDGGASAREERNARGGTGSGGKGRGLAQRGGGKGGGGKRAPMSSAPKAEKSQTGALGAALMDAFKKG